MDWLVAQLPEEVPECEVNDGNCCEWKALSTVIKGGTVHLLEEGCGVAGIGTKEETREVLFNEPACWWACRCC